MRCGDMITTPTRARLTRTSFTSGKSWNQILKSHGSFSLCMAVATNSSDEVDALMSNVGFNSGLATPRAVDIHVSASLRRNSGDSSRYRELELKLTILQKDYADLHTALVEAAQVHRRLCA